MAARKSRSKKPSAGNAPSPSQLEAGINMSGLVSELQRACLDSNLRTAEVPQKAYVVARKLGIKEFEDWMG